MFHNTCQDKVIYDEFVIKLTSNKLTSLEKSFIQICNTLFIIHTIDVQLVMKITIMNSDNIIMYKLL